MYQFALIKMIHNVKTETYHPILYYDHPFPGPVETQPVMRYKSSGHHTTGFKDRAEAVKDVERVKLMLESDQHDTVLVEIDPNDDIEWTGEGIPGDTQIRPLPTPPVKL